jgi:hypothetical protein
MPESIAMARKLHASSARRIELPNNPAVISLCSESHRVLSSRSMGSPFSEDGPRIRNPSRYDADQGVR